MKFTVFAVLIVSLLLTACSSRQEVRDTDVTAAPQTQPESAEEAAAKSDGARQLSTEQAPRDMFGDPEADQLFVIHFPFDSSNLSNEMQKRLQKNADFLRQHPDTKIVIEGHTDERGTADYNLALGERRAKAVREYLATLGIDRNRMETVSYGSEQPVHPASNEEAWSQNRRAQFREL